MQSRGRIFDDLARVTNGAASVLSGVRDEAEGALRHRLERMLAGMDLVSREEFDAVRDMAANARREEEALRARLAALEATVAELTRDAAPEAGTNDASADAQTDTQGGDESGPTN